MWQALEQKKLNIVNKKTLSIFHFYSFWLYVIEHMTLFYLKKTYENKTKCEGCWDIWFVYRYSVLNANQSCSRLDARFSRLTSLSHTHIGMMVTAYPSFPPIFALHSFYLWMQWNVPDDVLILSILTRQCMLHILYDWCIVNEFQLFSFLFQFSFIPLPACTSSVQHNRDKINSVTFKYEVISFFVFDEPHIYRLLQNVDENNTTQHHQQQQHHHHTNNDRWLEMEKPFSCACRTLLS